MASQYYKYLWIICLITIVLISLFEEVDCRRGGGGGGSRGSSSRGSRSWGRSNRSWGRNSRRSSGGSTRSYKNVVLRGRITKGSSHYTASTWRTAAMAGLIFGGVSYATRYPSRRKLPPICTNKYAIAPKYNGKVYGHFICPRQNETMYDIYCCGPRHREFCCNETSAKMYYGQHHSGGTSSITVAAVFGIIAAGVITVAVFVFCCKKRGNVGRVLRTASGKRGNSGLPQPEIGPSYPYPDSPPPPGPFYPPPPMPNPGASAPYAPPPAPGVAPYYPPPDPNMAPYPGPPEAPPPPYPAGPIGDTPYPPYPPPHQMKM